MIELDQLAKLLRGATINIIGGTGNTVYTGPVQINHHNYAASQSERVYVCGRCGMSDTNPRLFNAHFAGGHTCWQCYQRDIDNTAQRIEARYHPAPLPAPRQDMIEVAPMPEYVVIGRDGTEYRPPLNRRDEWGW